MNKSQVQIGLLKYCDQVERRRRGKIAPLVIVLLSLWKIRLCTIEDGAMAFFLPRHIRLMNIYMATVSTVNHDDSIRLYACT